MGRPPPRAAGGCQTQADIPGATRASPEAPGQLTEPVHSAMTAGGIATGLDYAAGQSAQASKERGNMGCANPRSPRPRPCAATRGHTAPHAR